MTGWCLFKMAHITSISQESWQWHITKPGESLGKLYEEDFYTYEEAELECLKKLIEIVKNGKSLEHSHEYSIKEQSVDKKSHT